MEKAEYKMVEFASSVSDTKSIEKSSDNGTTNLLPGNRAKTADLEEMESYETTENLEFEAAEVKESFEKKKKRRNYIEFRPDYITT
ncbi:MAG: hypothetical protein ACFFCP_18170 [Promethearchaeota archaeon]